MFIYSGITILDTMYFLNDCFGIQREANMDSLALQWGFDEVVRNGEWWHITKRNEKAWPHGEACSGRGSKMPPVTGYSLAG